ncbi:MAG: TIGR03960 family B12-binding radical SAM protein [Clostridia bacterium]|nr:TIGR03960 family B12-binding radical SAM protein [Clostridia bacterium]
MIDTAKLDQILPLVEKPGRYIGNELGCVKKSQDLPIRFLFAFPDVYEVGMSHLGSTILYHLTNEREDTYAERTYAPFPDMQEQMIKAGIPLYSLETYTEASAFDIIGFNLSYEMCYTTVLSMLDLAGIPLLAADRKDSPIIMAGGTCTYNPEPLADFIDLFVIGEGEEVNNELLDLYAEHKRKGLDKQAFLKDASAIPGVYVPSLVEVTYHEDGTVAKIAGENLPVRKRFIENMDTAYYPEKLIVPNVEIVHDRVVLEIFRGCTRGCRFCQAGFIYRPVREKNLETLMAQAHRLIAASGYDEMSLSSLSSGDYSCIEELSVRLLDELKDKHVSPSLPSLRVDSFQKEYAQKMQNARKSGFTFAPEAGTQRLRDVINKNVTEEDILRGVGYAFESGASTVKLYFMIGLPTETFEDLDGMVELVGKIRDVYYKLPKEQRNGMLKINVSASSFVPKPFTPFQWEPQNDTELLHEKQRYLREKFKGMKGVRFAHHETPISFLEAVFARGDRRLGKVLLYARQAGSQFDSWQDHFNLDWYTEAFEKAGIDPKFYAYRERSLDELMPWDHIHCGVTNEFMLRELRRAKAGKTTPDCRQGCLRCGFEGVCGK